jgi:hypothetical protein
MSLVTFAFYMTFLDEPRQMHWAIPIAGMVFDATLLFIMRTT